MKKTKKQYRPKIKHPDDKWFEDQLLAIAQQSPNPMVKLKYIEIMSRIDRDGR